MNQLYSIAFLNAFIGVVAAADYTLSSKDSYEGNDKPTKVNSAMVGFALSLNSTAIDRGTSTLLNEVILDGFTIKDSSGSTGNGVTYGFVVLDNFGNNTVLGVSTGTQTTSQNGTSIFTFKAADGTSALTLNPASTYRFITVGQDVLTLIARDTTKTYVLSGGGAGEVQHTTEGNTVTVTKGLKAPGILGYQGSTSVIPADSAIIVSSNLAQVYTSNGNHISPILSDIHLNNVPTPAVPEPATATLSLLALAGLAARRRRA